MGVFWEINLKMRKGCGNIRLWGGNIKSSHERPGLNWVGLGYFI